MRHRFPGRRAFLALMALPMVAPGIVLGVSLLLFWRTLGFKTGFTSLLLGHTLLALPYCTFIIMASLARFDRTLEDAARGLGAGEAAVLLRVVLPNITPGLLGALLFGFTISIGEFVVSFFLTSAGITTLPIRIYSIVKVGITPEINAVSTLILAATVILTLAAIRLTWSRGRKTKHRRNCMKNTTASGRGRLPRCWGCRDQPAPAQDKIGGEINILSWGNYIDFALPSFEEKYGVKINIDYYADEQEAMNKIRAAGVGTHDIVFLGAGFEDIAIKQGLIAPHGREPRVPRLPMSTSR